MHGLHGDEDPLPQVGGQLMMWYAQLVCTVLLGPEVAHLRQLIWGVRTPLPQAMSSKAQASKPVTTAAGTGFTPKLHIKQTVLRSCSPTMPITL
mmetsp:Transcript_91400/g.221954  ORF Transcript_91400/g.221954 Transcript_91400/m.221954 type:complete len:94 (-) Transcript_91400:381-662(-)